LFIFSEKRLTLWEGVREIENDLSEDTREEIGEGMAKRKRTSSGRYRMIQAKRERKKRFGTNSLDRGDYLKSIYRYQCFCSLDYT
jgi:hypothetical protein